MNKKWFGFSVFVLIFSSIMTFLYFLALFVSPFIMVPNLSKEMMIGVILFGLGIGITMMYFSVKALYRHGMKVTIIEHTKTDLNQGENKKI